jgi:hypothetical protein
MIRSDLTPEINEIAEAVHQHNQRLTQRATVWWRGVSVSGSRVEFDSLYGLVNLWLEFLEQVNDLLSSFMTLVFEGRPP